MKTVWVYGRYYNFSDDFDFDNFVHQKRMEWLEERRRGKKIQSLQKENERLKYELEEKEHLLALREKREPNISNNANDISQGTRRSIVKEAKNISAQYALKGYKGISTNKGIKIDWKNK